MNKYIGTKTVSAKPMNHDAFCAYVGKTETSSAKEGYLVEYEPDPSSLPNHPDHAGYVSWSPKEVFEKSYRPVTGLTFGAAIEALKAGKRVRRAGWNGKGMFLWLLPAGEIPKTAIHDSALRTVIDEHVEGDTFAALPSIRMWTRNAEGRWGVLTGWLASQTDMLNDDWEILE